MQNRDEMTDTELREKNKKHLHEVNLDFLCFFFFNVSGVDSYNAIEMSKDFVCVQTAYMTLRSSSGFFSCVPTFYFSKVLIFFTFFRADGDVRIFVHSIVLAIHPFWAQILEDKGKFSKSFK